ncbi:hypothetical protein JR316_0008691 [Psilocybe cubensis]|uniref:Uncharacterized protein n=2 Tax=Psilocybe cubensis TaxID=181762 RepID=A0ACB8GRH8_PSICU|nr:hypothetical protein JR316_0008691 [Psilocybe cubensis]KAH9478238.1 hypothetical protein JR316_0008691 [Psilocybe cubensis]
MVTSIYDLDFDVLNTLFSVMRPMDIINMRRTCKLMYLATQPRNIWLKVLANVVADNNIFKGTYHIESMTDDDLERAAVFPSILLYRAKGPHALSKVPLCQRILDDICEEDEIAHKDIIFPEESLYRDFDNAVLVPGGRFLFTISASEMDGDVYVKLWDLGQPTSKRYSRITLVARFVGRYKLRILATAPTPDELGIRIVVNEETRAGNTLRVFEIHPFSKKPEFKQIATIQASNAVYSGIMSGNLVVCSSITAGPPPTQSFFQGHILIWDYVHKTSATLQPDGPLPDHTYLHGNHIITFCKNILSVWSIPPLQPGDPEYTYDNGPDSPIWSQPLTMWGAHEREQSEKHNSMENHSLGWLTGPDSPRYLVCRGYESDVDFDHLAIFRLDASWNPADPLSAPCILAQLDRRTIGTNSMDIILSWSFTTQACQENVVFMSSTFGHDDKFSLSYIPWFASGSTNPAHTIQSDACVLQKGKEGCKSLQFCPVSGRGFSISTHTGELRILELSV